LSHNLAAENRRGLPQSVLRSGSRVGPAHCTREKFQPGAIYATRFANGALLSIANIPKLAEAIVGLWSCPG
jgi:hypothetical protein